MFWSTLLKSLQLVVGAGFSVDRDFFKEIIFNNTVQNMRSHGVLGDITERYQSRLPRADYFYATSPSDGDLLQAEVVSAIERLFEDNGV